MTMQDVVSNQYCAANYSGIIESRYAQYIVESPTNGNNNELYSLPKFSTMTIQGLYKDDSGNRYGLDDTVNNNKYYKITMTHDVTSSGTVKAVPSSVDSRDKFTATWQSSRDAP